MKEESTVKKRSRYDAEFKKNVLKMIEDGRSIPSLPQTLEIVLVKRIHLSLLSA
jgi:hypothetical protein